MMSRIAPIDRVAGLALAASVVAAGSCTPEAPPKPPETPLLSAEHPAAPLAAPWIKTDGPIAVETCFPREATLALRPPQRVFECNGSGWTDRVESRNADAEHGLALFGGPRDDLWPPIAIVTHGVAFGPQQPGFEGEFGCGLTPVAQPFDAQRMDACAPLRLEDDGSIVVATGAEAVERVAIDTAASEPELLTGTPNNPPIVTYRTPLGVRVTARNGGRWSAPAVVPETTEQSLPCPTRPPCPAMCVAAERHVADVRTIRRADHGALLFVAYQRVTSTSPSTSVLDTTCGEVPGSICAPANRYRCAGPEPTSTRSLALSLWDVTSGSPIRVASAVVQGATFVGATPRESTVDVTLDLADGTRDNRALSWSHPAPTKP